MIAMPADRLVAHLRTALGTWPPPPTTTAAHATEISVGTEETARGAGIGRRLVASAARRVLEEGKVPTYLHDAANHASARVAEASGFPDRGWRLLAPVPR